MYRSKRPETPSRVSCPLLRPSRVVSFTRRNSVFAVAPGGDSWHIHCSPQGLGPREVAWSSDNLSRVRGTHVGLSYPREVESTTAKSLTFNVYISVTEELPSGNLRR